MQLLKQSTTVTIKMGPFLDATDGVTEETALSPAVEVAKNGAAYGARNSATAVAHDAEGWYNVELDATDTGTLGRLQVKAQDAANHCPVWHNFMVLPANVFDSIVGDTDLLVVDALDVADKVWDEALSGHVTAGTAGIHLTDASSGTIQRNTATTMGFTMVLSSDHITAATGLTFTAKQFSLDGGAFSAIAASVSEVGNGVYAIALSAAETDGGLVILRFAASTADDRVLIFTTQPKAG